MYNNISLLRIYFRISKNLLVAIKDWVYKIYIYINLELMEESILKYIKYCWIIAKNEDSHYIYIIFNL